MSAPPSETCTFCGGAAGVVTWRRSSPDLLRAKACVGCHERLAREANETARASDDGARLVRQATMLGGEVWAAQDVDFWFKHPVSLPGFDRARYHERLPRV